MSKKTTYLSLIALTILLSLNSCKNENSGYREYFNSMGNNPVQVVDWLIDLKESLYKQNAQISLFEYENVKYYVVEVFENNTSNEIKSYTVYEANDNEPIILIQLDNKTNAEENEDIDNFLENAQLLALLWSNQKAE